MKVSKEFYISNFDLEDINKNLEGDESDIDKVLTGYSFGEEIFYSLKRNFSELVGMSDLKFKRVFLCFYSVARDSFIFRPEAFTMLSDEKYYYTRVFKNIWIKRGYKPYEK